MIKEKGRREEHKVGKEGRISKRETRGKNIEEGVPVVEII